MSVVTERFFKLFYPWNGSRPEPLLKLFRATKLAPETVIEEAQTLLDNVREMSLFSPNELMEDMSTASIPLLLLPFMIGSALEMVEGIEGRLGRLRQAKVNFAAFVQTTCHFGREIKEFKRILHLFNADETVPTKMTPGERRTQLIERRRLLQGIDSKIERTCMEIGSTIIGGETVLKTDDEGTTRDLWELILQRCLYDALASMSMIDQETPLLTTFQSKGAESDPVLRVDGDGSTLGKPFILKINNTAELLRHYRDRVFKPGYVLPSVSLAEAAESEMNMEAHRLANAQKSTVKHYQDDGYCDCGTDDCHAPFHADSEEEDAQEGQRRWDDWKDDNPKGSGNTMVNRG